MADGSVEEKEGRRMHKSEQRIVNNLITSQAKTVTEVLVCIEYFSTRGNDDYTPGKRMVK